MRRREVAVAALINGATVTFEMLNKGFNNVEIERGSWK